MKPWYSVLAALLAVPALSASNCPGVGDDDSADDDSAADDDDSGADDDDAAAACADPIAVDCGDKLEGESTVGDDAEVDEWCGTGLATTGPEEYFAWTAGAAGEVRVDMSPAAQDLDLFVLGGDAAGCDPDDCLGSSQLVGDESVTFTAQAGATYYFVVDGYDGAEDSFDISLDCAPVADEYLWVAIRSRTTNPDDIDNNTPGPDVDAILLTDGAGGEHWANDWYYVQGPSGDGGNVNDDPDDALGPSDAWTGGTPGEGDCELGDDASGDSAFWSMGGGDPALGDEGWMIVALDGVDALAAGDVITVFEVGSVDCDNVDTPRDDVYEVYIGLASVDPGGVTVSAFDGAGWISLGESGEEGGIAEFDVAF
jgi:hypothetical protein